MLRRSPVVPSLLLLGAAVLLAGCNDASVASAPPPAPPDVSVVTIKASPRAIIRELPGRIAPLRVAEVRPRVSGIIVERTFQQGSRVTAGDALYQIDPKPFEVELQAAEAALAKADAVKEQAAQHAHRIAILATTQAASQATNETAIASLRQAEADIAARNADVARARLNLGYATIRAPISGIIGAALLSEGALVVQNEAASLATIQQLDSVYADFTQSVSEMNRLRRDFERGDLDRIAPGAAKVRLILDDGSAYPLDGKLLFSDAKVDANTGQVTLRGEFSNPKQELLPGMYVRVQIEQGRDPDAISVPPQAIQRNSAGGSEVYVVKDDNRVIAQPVRTGNLVEGQLLITEGLEPGQRVVVEGFQKFAAGDVVNPSAWKDAGASADGPHRAASAEHPQPPAPARAKLD
ncbi:efflux RND transporter periplasmic adaptor subunit [Bradyrhizobium sp. U87765 SZCCT0131]|uniref:efflux RND transporter periplasmic adaptor subunit n=1 Tax=unclassified Bradyrhizobium TaxID=2631580 RepID=UPI001BAD3373|nr:MULTISPECIES: efflux RND transporter periplasmic adaptor subunit [unclassified Bradyrhizobium]MBR1216957.1 efflux RND transporter periplasmic adaptor subunit [Bradyrhizobium sp. U87765 SZCCT0131]MBR1259287.1 efflux RND transporter periplasmic adaptor subunit [Bradyrhizobium sp. U87765 SZCCT0134]MBR1305428.1 efflux RND transporter periplasmic adaptor subunit [Bradyrhizobium sp. U87765 SZCCT0110]MBR1321214.1 efflux RND transporter periplasmic adaptor subunit [Bradyrhizobium sp. U87765 SZCCT010